MIPMKSKIEPLVAKLWDDPSEKNWKTFAAALKKSDIKYYKIIFANEGKLNKMQDITKSVAELYDAKYKLITKVPIFKKEGKRTRGATIYLTGLQVSNKAS